MDEQKNEQAQEPKSALKKGIEKQGKRQAKKFLKKIIVAKAPIILIFIIIAFLIVLMISVFLNFLDEYKSKETKEANSSAIHYGKKAEANKITVSIDNVTSKGGYKLTYKFEDEKGNVLSDNDAIKQIKSDLLKENEKIDLAQFSDSELKIIGSLMYNGLDILEYDEEKLKALAIFVKADIAGKNFDLRKEKKEVTVGELSQNDEVYGTLELHKTTATPDAKGNATYKEIKLEYISYDELRNLIRQGNNEALEKFSIDDNGNLVIAKYNSSTIKYTYQSESGKELSDADMARINEENIGEDVDELTIKEYELTVNYMQYIKKYIASYGLLVDLLIETNNAEFCLEIAELALNSKIVINIREEQVDTYTYDLTNYTQTTLLYDYVAYELRGYTVTESWEQITSGEGEVPKIYGEVPDLNQKKGVYTWSFLGENYKLDYENSLTKLKWTLYKKTQTETATAKETGPKALIVGEHVSESYDGYTIDENCTAKEIFTYNVIKEESTTNFKYEIDISEIDCWYLVYNKTYTQPTKQVKTFPAPEGVNGQYPQEASIIQEETDDSSIINGDEHVVAFIEQKKKDFLDQNPSVNTIEGGATSLEIKGKSKTDSKVLEYEETRTIYCFGDETNIDTTKVQFKNVEYVDNKPTFTPEGEKGFLYIYDKYVNMDIDLFLQNDAEKELFEILEADAETAIASDIIKFLLYVYDGIDRGVTDLDKTFKVIDMTLMEFTNTLKNTFGCNISRDEFINSAQAYGESILSGLAAQIYDICTSYGVNPCIAYGWAALESVFGENAVDDKNLFPMGSRNGATSGFKNDPDSYEESIEDFCQWVVNAADPSSSQYSSNYTRAQEYATVNSKFKGTPETNMYALFSTYLWVGDTHTPDARAYIKNTYEFLNNGVYECNHADSDETTLKERADYMQYQVELRIKIAEEVFGEKIFVGGNGNFETIDNIAWSGNMEAVMGIYTSNSGRKYIEWRQGAGEIGGKPLRDKRLIMASHGCQVYACGTLASSTGIDITIREVYDIYMDGGSYPTVIKNILEKYGIEAEVCTGNANDHDEFISVLTSGKGIMIYVGSKGGLYTDNVHWITLADIRYSELGSDLGYDIYALTSNNRKGHGWQPIEAVLYNLAGSQYIYIDDGN